ncbi:hypothetical protein ACFQJC_04765 [Haloferax namakaokahaiae]|uniref:DUF4832 domain-containing protein n=1 Tax=Haloferax namakaokahaiae TaxID=1748331 RepID=A0ABD5ZC93_9EURY
MKIRGFDVSDTQVYPDRGEELELSIKLRNTYDEEKVAFVIPYMDGETNYSYYERMYLNPETMGGNAVVLSPHEETWEDFRWVPPLKLKPGIYNIKLNVCEDNHVGFWNTYDSWMISNAIAAGLDVDPGCYGAVKDYQSEIRSSGGPGQPPVAGPMAIPGLISLIYSQSQVASQCSD